ncbi:MAG: PspC domain-containing protein [Sphingobacteriaceae bacterium]
MNKTIIINISGVIFHMEEDAYELLKSYMTDIKRHFSNTPDSLEITNDIENRIAEMLSEILKRENKQVIVTADIQEVIAQMGTTEDFISEDENSQQEEAYTDFSANRKLFRDPDDHLLGGVCTGIANYFNIDSVWIRLVFALSFLLAGSGILLYVILWIIIPKALTRADRMAMKGEKIDLQGFKRNFDEEIKNVRTVLSDTHQKAKPFLYKSRDFISDFFDHLLTFIGGTGKVVLKVFGIGLLVIGFLMFVGFSGLFIGVVVFGESHIAQFPFNIINPAYSNMMYISAFLLVIIPLIALILFTISVVFNRRSLNRSAGFILLLIWLVAFSFVIFYSAKTGADFRSKAAFNQTINLQPAAAGTYYLRLNTIKDFSPADSVKLGLGKTFSGKVILNDDNDWIEEAPENVNIYIERADVAVPVLIETISAHGKNYEEALEHARSTQYNFVQQDSLLTFDSQLRNNQMTLWRNQRIKLTLKIPLNSRLVIPQTLNRYLNNVNFWDCIDPDNNEKDPSAHFVMKEGGMECWKDTLKKFK